MRSSIVLIISLTTIVITACKNRKNERNRGLDSGLLYLDYRITAEEENETVSCIFKYTYGSRDGRTVLLSEPASVELDGIKVEPDSAGFEGVYYELLRPLADFAGTHHIIFTGSDKKQYKEEFEFLPFSLLEELPDKIARQPFVIKLRNLPEKTIFMNIVMTDTSYESNDVIDIIPVSNGVVPITQEMLARLAPGPINLELSREEIKPLKEKTRTGGRLVIQYGLKREFELID
ncbi:MAG: hypothetical protein ACJ749_10225 [Flavisolibacter sp.]